MKTIIDTLEALERKIESRKDSIASAQRELKKGEEALRGLEERRQIVLERVTEIKRGEWYIASVELAAVYTDCKAGDSIVIKDFPSEKNMVRVGLFDWEWGAWVALSIVQNLEKTDHG